MPDLSTIVNHTHFANEVVNLEKLKNLALEVEVLEEILLVFLSRVYDTLGDVRQIPQIFGLKDGVILKAVRSPFAQLGDHLVLRAIQLEAFTEEAAWDELFAWGEGLEGEDSPAAVEGDIGCELGVSVVRSHVCPMHANDLTCLLADR